MLKNKITTTKRVIASLMAVILVVLACNVGVFTPEKAKAATTRFPLGVNAIKSATLKQGGTVIGSSTEPGNVSDANANKAVDLVIAYAIDDPNAFKQTQTEDGKYHIEYQIGDVFIPEDGKMSGKVVGKYGDYVGVYTIEKNANGNYMAYIDIDPEAVTDKEHFSGTLTLSGKLDNEQIELGTKELIYEYAPGVYMPIPVQPKTSYPGYVSTSKSGSIQDISLENGKVLLSFTVTSTVEKDVKSFQLVDTAIAPLTNFQLSSVTGASHQYVQNADGSYTFTMNKDGGFKAGDQVVMTYTMEIPTSEFEKSKDGVNAVNSIATRVSADGEIYYSGGNTGYNTFIENRWIDKSVTKQGDDYIYRIVVNEGLGFDIGGTVISDSFPEGFALGYTAAAPGPWGGGQQPKFSIKNSAGENVDIPYNLIGAVGQDKTGFSLTFPQGSTDTYTIEYTLYISNKDVALPAEGSAVRKNIAIFANPTIGEFRDDADVVVSTDNTFVVKEIVNIDDKTSTVEYKTTLYGVKKDSVFEDRAYIDGAYTMDGLGLGLGLSDTSQIVLKEGDRTLVRGVDYEYVKYDKWVNNVQEFFEIYTDGECKFKIQFLKDIPGDVVVSYKMNFSTAQIPSVRTYTNEANFRQQTSSVEFKKNALLEKQQGQIDKDARTITWYIFVNLNPDTMSGGKVTPIPQMTVTDILPEGTMFKSAAVQLSSGMKLPYEFETPGSGLAYGTSWADGSPVGPFQCILTQEGDRDKVDFVFSNIDSYYRIELVADIDPRSDILTKEKTTIVNTVTSTGIDVPDSSFTAKNEVTNIILDKKSGDGVSITEDNIDDLFSKAYLDSLTEQEKQDLYWKKAAESGHVSYTLSVNSGAGDLNPDADTVTLEDSLPAGTTLDMKTSVKVYDAKTNAELDASLWSFTYNSTDNKLSVILPDEKAVNVTYDIIINGEKAGTTVSISNRAKLIGTSTSIEKIDQKSFIVSDSSSSFESDESGIKIVKYDESGAGVLPGAKFKLVNAKTGEVAAEKITDENGIIEFDELDKNVIYYFQETKAPAGYKLDDTKQYFCIVDDVAAAEQLGAVTEDGNKVSFVNGDATISAAVYFRSTALNITNKPTDEEPDEPDEEEISIKVSKVDANGGAELENAKLELYKVTATGEELVEAWTSTKEVKVITTIEKDTEYVLRETVAPEGYTLTADSKFKIDSEGNVVTAGYTNAPTVSNDGVLLVEDTKTSVSISKVDANGAPLAGATLKLIDSTGAIVENEWTSLATAAMTFKGLKTDEIYKVVEVKAPNGYITSKDEIIFKITKSGTIVFAPGTDDEEEVSGIVVENSQTEVEISKIDVADGSKELPGATLQVIEVVDNTETKIDEWVSTSETHKIKGLAIGVEYILRETVAPEGYAVTTETRFKLDENGKVTTAGLNTPAKVENNVILVENTKTSVSISKVDVTTKAELENAHIQILDSEGKPVDEWVSGTTAHVVKGLKTGETYKLHETIPPTGYTIAEDTTFTLKADGTIDAEKTTTSVSDDGVLLVEDTLKDSITIKISKVDINGGAELEGAVLQLYEVAPGGEKLVEEWTSQKAVKIISDLTEGRTYILRETVAPKGYKLTTDTKFRIDADGNVTLDGVAEEEAATIKNGVILVEDTITSVSISKVDVTTKAELEGAHIQIIKTEDGKEVVVKEWDSTGEPYVVTGLETGVEYTLRETVAPDGYKITTDTKFMLDEDGNVTTDGIDEEEAATVDDDGVILVEDTKTSVSISKVDVNGGAELENAHIQIFDSEGNPVEEWISGTTAYVVEGLKTGETYTLRETVAPDGYKITTDTTFTLKADGTIDADKTTTTVSEEGVLLVEDDQTVVNIGKVDEEGKPLAGATLKLLDSTGAIVDSEWTSLATAAKTFKGLKTEELYKVVEVSAPNGYVTSKEEVIFKITKSGTIVFAPDTSDEEEVLGIVVENSQTEVEISKIDVADGSKELPGATLQVIEVVDNTETKIDEWVSTSEIHKIKGLAIGVEYILRETVAPEGYAVITDTKFKLDENGKATTDGIASEEAATINEKGVILVENTKTSVSISKVDVTTKEELENAHIQILDSEGKPVEEWISGTTAYVVEGLKTGETYTLRETVAPNGYLVTTDTTFTLKANGTIDADKTTTTVSEDGKLLVEDTQTSVDIAKVDADGNPLAGATLKIVDSTGEIVGSEWITETTAKTIKGLLVNEYYKVVEVKAPDGYVLSGDEIIFKISEDGSIILDPDATDSKEVVGITVENSQTEVEISKVDIADGKELAGATLQVIEVDNGQETVIKEWISTEEAHKITGLKTGVTYILRETVAPKGYDVTTDTTFVLKADGSIDTDKTTTTVSDDGILLVEDEATPEPEDTPTPTPTDTSTPTPTGTSNNNASPTPTGTGTSNNGSTPTPVPDTHVDTGDNSNVMMYIVLMCVALCGVLFVGKGSDESEE